MVLSAANKERALTQIQIHRYTSVNLILVDFQIFLLPLLFFDFSLLIPIFQVNIWLIEPFKQIISLYNIWAIQTAFKPL